MVVIRQLPLALEPPRPRKSTFEICENKVIFYVKIEQLLGRVLEV
jgi:hypothetical protein